MPKGLLGVGFIFLVLFLLYKIARLMIKVAAKICRVSRHKTMAKHATFPEEEPRHILISQNEFARIATKTAYRHRRTENVEIDDNSVAIEFSSQTGLSKNHAVITFSLSGKSVGNYSIRCDNPDSTIPRTIGDRIQAEIRSNI